MNYMRFYPKETDELKGNKKRYLAQYRNIAFFQSNFTKLMLIIFFRLHRRDKPDN